MTDFETVSVRLPSGRSLEGQRETRHSVWLEGWELAEVGDVVRIDEATWRVDDVQRARIGGQRATRLHVVPTRTESPSGWRSAPGAERGTEADEAPPAGPTQEPLPTGRELDRRLREALGDGGEARYASELSALLRLTSHMESLGYRLSYRRVGDTPIVGRVEPADGSQPYLEATGDTVADALCRVSLAALERWEKPARNGNVHPPPQGPSRRPPREGDDLDWPGLEEAFERG